jgi:uncharacterized protein with PhoU and TrkA domain
MSDPDDQPSNVKDLLAEAKDASELMVDLAYAAVFFNDEKLAEEVEDLQERLYGYLRRAPSRRSATPRRTSRA